MFQRSYSLNIKLYLCILICMCFLRNICMHPKSKLRQRMGYFIHKIYIFTAYSHKVATYKTWKLSLVNETPYEMN